MKFSKGLPALIVFVICMWAVVVVTYASQTKNGVVAGIGGVPFPHQSASCSSSSSSGGAE